MNDSKWPAAVSLTALASVCQRIDNVLKMLFKMDLQRIPLSLKRIYNCFSQIGSHMQWMLRASRKQFLSSKKFVRMLCLKQPVVIIRHKGGEGPNVILCYNICDRDSVACWNNF